MSSPTDRRLLIDLLFHGSLAIYSLSGILLPLFLSFIHRAHIVPMLGSDTNHASGTDKKWANLLFCFICFGFEQPCVVVLAGLECLILLPQPPKCWD